MCQHPQQFDVPDDEQRYLRQDKPICRFCKILMRRAGGYKAKKRVYWVCPECGDKAQTRRHIL